MFSYLAFGDEKYSYLIFPMSLMLIGLILHTSCYGYFRGKFQMALANSMQIINICVVPIAVFSLSKTTPQFLAMTGFGWIAISTVFTVFILRKSAWDANRLIPCAKELLYYGLQRVLGDFAAVALFTLPATFTAHMCGLKEGGYVAFGTSIVSMAGVFFAPVGLVLLPEASQLIANRNFERLRFYIKRLLKVTFFLTATGVVIFEIFADKILSLYLGRSFPDITPIVRISVLGGIAYTIYASMRSILDAYYVMAVNTRNILISLLFFITFSGVVMLRMHNYFYLLIGFVLSIFLLSALTLREVKSL